MAASDDPLPICIGVVDTIICGALTRIVCQDPGRGSPRPIAERIQERIYIERHTGIFSHQTGQGSLKGFDVSLPIQRNQRLLYASIRIRRHDRQCSIIDSGCFGVAMLPSVSESELLENEVVARVQLKSALHVASCFFPVAFASVDQARVQECISIVRQRLSGNSQFAAGALVVAKALVVVIRRCKVDFTRVWLEAYSAIQRGLGQLETGRRVIMAPKVRNTMHSGEQAPSL